MAVERVFAIAIASLCLATLVALAFDSSLTSEPILNSPESFNIPAFNIYFLFASCVAAALLALSIALRSGLSSPAYSLAAGMAAWSNFSTLLVGPEFLHGPLFYILYFVVWFQLTWSAARFALHFPSELPPDAARARGGVARRWAIDLELIRRVVDSAVYPVTVGALGLTIAFAFDPLSTVFGARAMDQLLGWSCLLLGAAMCSCAILLLKYQREHADEVGIRRLRWIWLGTWGGVAVLVVAFGIAFPLLSDTDYMYLAFLLAGLGPYWMIGCMTVAVFFSDALDPRLALRRATLYTILAALMTTVFIVVEGVVQGYIIVNTGLPDTTAIVVAGTVVGVSFSPIRRWTERNVKRVVEQLMPAEVMAAGRRERTTIAFVDLSGYTSLADKDERSALVLAAGFHKALAKEANKNGGRVVKKIGDALLLEFRSNDDALRAIRAGSAAFAKLVIALELPELRPHAGVHTGEVVHMPDDDVMGAAVNVAARLMSAAEVDQVIVSIGEDELASTDPTAVERVECKGISVPVACRRLVIAAT